MIVIGKTARNVSEAQALDHVFGYCTGNDFTARELQRAPASGCSARRWTARRRSGPTWSAPTRSPIRTALKLECRVNGELRQSSNTADMIFNCRQIVSYVSRYITLAPGDIIFTGTPEGAS